MSDKLDAVSEFCTVTTCAATVRCGVASELLSSVAFSKLAQRASNHWVVFFSSSATTEPDLESTRPDRLKKRKRKKRNKLLLLNCYFTLSEIIHTLTEIGYGGNHCVANSSFC